MAQFDALWDVILEVVKSGHQRNAEIGGPEGQHFALYCRPAEPNEVRLWPALLREKPDTDILSRLLKHMQAAGRPVEVLVGPWPQAMTGFEYYIVRPAPLRNKKRGRN